MVCMQISHFQCKDFFVEKRSEDKCIDIIQPICRKNLTMDEIHDIHGLRLIVEKEEDCYIALNIVHQLWPKVLGKLKDYIIHPKFNGYGIDLVSDSLIA